MGVLLGVNNDVTFVSYMMALRLELLLGALELKRVVCGCPSSFVVLGYFFMSRLHCLAWRSFDTKFFLLLFVSALGICPGWSLTACGMCFCSSYFGCQSCAPTPAL